MQQLIAEGLVEQGEQTRLYRLSIDFFALAARAGDNGAFRELCRPSLLRLGASLGDSVFLLVRSSFDAVCLDRCDGPFPIRTFTGDAPPAFDAERGVFVEPYAPHEVIGVMHLAGREQKTRIFRLNRLDGGTVATSLRFSDSRALCGRPLGEVDD